MPRLQKLGLPSGTSILLGDAPVRNKPTENRTDVPGVDDTELVIDAAAKQAGTHATLAV